MTSVQMNNLLHKQSFARTAFGESRLPRERIRTESFGRPRSRELQVAAQPPDLNSVRELVDRDKQALDIGEAVDPFVDEGPVSSDRAERGQPPAAGRQAAKARSQVVQSEARSASLPDAVSELKSASQAINKGIAALQSGDPEAAIQIFQRALELPGKGAFRMQGSAKEYSCASDGEEIAALYNLACAYAACGKPDAALASLEGAIDTGFNDWDVLRADADLKIIQGPKLEKLLQKRMGGSFFDRFNPFRPKT